MKSEQRIYYAARAIDKCTVAEWEYLAELIQEGMDKKMGLFEVLALRDINGVITEKEKALFPSLKEQQKL